MTGLTHVVFQTARLVWHRSMRCSDHTVVARCSSRGSVGSTVVKSNYAPLGCNRLKRIADAKAPSASRQSGPAASGQGAPCGARPSSRTGGRGLPGRWNRRLGGRARCLQEARGGAARRQRHGLHPGPASRSDPREHDGGPAGRPHGDDRAAGSGRDADRARPPLCHPARDLSVCRRRRPAPLAAPGAARRAPAVRLPAALAGGGVRRARRLRDPFGNRRRRQPRAEGREGEGRAGHRAGPRRGRL